MGVLSCFTNTESISVFGGNEPQGDGYYARVAGINCNPATGIFTADDSVGLPGLVLVSTPYQVLPKDL